MFLNDLSLNNYDEILSLFNNTRNILSTNVTLIRKAAMGNVKLFYLFLAVSEGLIHT